MTTVVVIPSFQFGDAKVSKEFYSATLFKYFFSNLSKLLVLRS